MAPTIPTIPAKPPLPGQTPPAEAKPAEGEARIVRLPQNIANIQQALELVGKVTQSGSDGRVVIQTDKGTIEIQIPRNQPVPAQGETVEVDIPAGRPPQTLIVTQQKSPDSSQTTNTDRSTSAPPPARTTETPVSVRVETKAPAADTKPLEKIPDQQLVQLKPIPAADVRLPPPEDALTQSITNIQGRTQLKAESIASKTTDQMSAQFLKTFPALVEKTSPAPLYQQLAEQSGLQTIKSLTTMATLAPAITNQSAFTQNALTSLLGNTQAQPSAINLIPPKTSKAATIQLSATALLGKAFEAIPMNKPEAVFFTKPLEVIAQKIADIARAQISIGKGVDIAPQLTAPQMAGLRQPQLGAAPELNPLQNPGVQKPLILQNMTAQALPATVIGQTSEKFPIISMFIPALGEQRFFALQMPVENIQVGMQLAITPQNMPSSVVPTQNLLAHIALPSPIPMYFMTPEPWPLMDQINQTLIQAMPQAAQAFSNITPSPANPASFGAAALFFVAAVRGGDLTQWLGDKAIDSLRRGGRADILSRLSQETGTLNRMASEPVSQDWRGMSIPLMWQNEIHKMTLFYKQDSSSDNENDNKGKHTRFIFDLKLDQMGNVQLDGLFRTTRLDLILRTQAPLSQSMQMTMRRAYTNALELAGANGEISFQNRPDQWVTIKSNGKSDFGASA